MSFRLYAANQHQVELPIEELTFPDGQPHIKIPGIENWSILDVLIKGAIRTPSDLFQLQLINSVLRAHPRGVDRVQFTCSYLMGARMDRAISETEPFTLLTVADTINSCNFDIVRLFDVHSDVALALIRNSQSILPHSQLSQVVMDINTGVYMPPDLPPLMVIPDAGAVKRVEALNARIGWEPVQMLKHRDTTTGKLKDFRLHGDVNGRACLIVDDICDGGGTFTAEAQVLKKAGAEWVGLYVSHGIFSKGLPLAGVDYVWTTDSFSDNVGWGTTKYKVLKF